jgi:hypothetical protein
MNHGEFSLANFVPLPFGAVGGGLVVDRFAFMGE